MAEAPRRLPSLVGLIDDGVEGRPLIAVIDDVLDAQHDLEQQLRARFGTNNTDFRALLFVYRRQRRRMPTRSSDLARALGLTTGAVAQVVGRLVARGHVVREGDPSDGRAGLLRLSESTRADLAETTTGLREDVDALLHDVDDHDEALIAGLLERLLAIYRQHDLGTAPR